MTIIKMSFSPVEGRGLQTHKSLEYKETPKTYQDITFDNDRCLAVLHKSNMMKPDTIMREAGWGSIYCLEGQEVEARDLLLNYIRKSMQKELESVCQRAFNCQKSFDAIDENFQFKFANSTYNNHSVVHSSGPRIEPLYLEKS